MNSFETNPVGTLKRLKKLEAEIERLQAMVHRKDERIKAWKRSSDEHESRNEALEAMVERLEGEVKHHQGTALAAVEDKDDEKIDPWHCRVCGERTGIGNGYCAMHGALAAVEDKT